MVYYSIRFAQSAGPVFYCFGSLFESIVTPWGHFWRPWDAAFRSKNILGRPRCPMTPQHRNKITLLDPFWDPKNHKKLARTIFKGGPEMVPKTGPHSGSQKVRFCCYLLHLSKVRRLRNGPHFGSCLKTRFAKNTKKWGNGGCPKTGAEKRSPSAKMSVYLRIRRLPDSPPSRARF